MGHERAIIFDWRHAAALVLALVAPPLMAVAAIVLAPARSAGASPIGCGAEGPVRTLGNPNEITLDLGWDLGVSGAGTIESDLITLLGGVDVDLDADGATDGRVAIAVAAGNGPVDDPTVDVYGGGADFVAENPAHALLRDGYGIDYANELTTPADPADAAEGPLHLQFSLFLDDPARWGAGTFGAEVTIPYTDGTVVEHDVYEVVLDTTGAVVPATLSPWPQGLRVSLFDDNLLHDALAVGVTTGEAAADGQFSPTRYPMSNLVVDVGIDQVADVPRGDDVRLGFTGALAGTGPDDITSVGMPGEMAVAVVNECDTLPQETFVGTSHSGDPAGVMPEAFEAGVSIYGDGDTNGDGVFDPDSERTLYVDGAIIDPPNLLGVTIGADDADVDGDGNLDGFDLDGDLGDDGHADDRLPWEHVAVHHDGVVAPDLEALIARRAIGHATGDIYLAASVEDLPPDTSFDRAGVPTALDADGDGNWDDVTGDGIVDQRDVALNADLGAFAFCPKDFTTYPASCITPPVPAGRVQLAFEQEIPTANANGSLPVELQSFGAAPADLVATEGAHFPLAPTGWLTTSTESITTTGAFGLDVVHTYLAAAGIDLAGLEDVAWDLRDGGKLVVHTNDLGAFGAEVRSTDLMDRSSARLWSMLADGPDDVALSFDTASILRDGDPIELSWDTGRARSGAAVGVDALVPNWRGEGDLTIAASAWIGTGDGSTDGLPTQALLTVDLVDGWNTISLTPLEPPECDPDWVPWPPGGGLPCLPTPTPPDGSEAMPAVLDVGFTTRSEAEEAAGLATRGKVTAAIPGDLEVNWFDDGTTIRSAELVTCEGETEPCPVTDLDATVVTTDWSDPVGHDALLGVDMIPVPDDDGREFPDFTALPGTAAYPLDWVHVVRHDDSLSTDTPPPGEVVDDGNRAGFDLHLAEVAQLEIAAATTTFDPPGPLPSQEVFNHLAACVEGTMSAPVDDADPALGLGIYQGESREGGGEAAATWVDAALSQEGTLYATVKANTPDPGHGGVIGDLNRAQIQYATDFPDETNLARVTTEDCEGNWHGADDRTLTGRVRRGTESSVAQTLQLGDHSAVAGGAGIPVPEAPGIDAALYTAEVGDTSYQGLDAAMRLDLPNGFTIRQPRFRRCGVGNWQLGACHDLPGYDATTSSEVLLDVTSSSEASLGSLDVEYITEPADPPGDGPDRCGPFDVGGVDPRLGDPCAERAALHVEDLGTALTVDGTLEQRRRDGYLHADVDVTNDRDIPFEAIEFTYRDDYRPATLGDPLEGGATDQPLAWLALDDVGPTLAIDATMWAPVYGWNGTAYGTGDCRTGWPSAIKENHVYPAGDDPSAWPTLGPRTPGSVRPAYLHGAIDLDPEDDGDPAETITAEVDSRVDAPADYDQPEATAVENWYDDGHRRTAKVGLDTGGVTTDGEVWGAVPGVQMHEYANPTFGEFELCADVDVPLNLEWSDASDLRGAVDLLKATVSLLDAERAAGADVTLSVRERTTAELTDVGRNVVTGIWAHELKTWLRAPLGKDWATRITDGRMSVGFLDPDDLKLEVLPHDTIGVQTDLATGWTAAGVAGNRFHGTVLLQALFHPDVEAVVAEDKGIQDVVDAWAGKEGLWQTVHDRTDTIYDWELPELAPGTTVVDGAFAHETHHECRAQEKKAEHDEFTPLATTPDGSTFEFAARWDNQRVQLFLIGRYANGEVRFVRELFDDDPGPKACMLDITGTIDIDEDTGRTWMKVDVNVTSNATPAPEDWDDGFVDTFLFDAAGNGWHAGSVDDALTAPGAVAGTPVELLGGNIGLPLLDCVWYPGDGTRITPGDPDMGELSTTAWHTYTFPGTYHVMQLCYTGPATSAGGNILDPYQALVVEGTVTVADPG